MADHSRKTGYFMVLLAGCLWGTIGLFSTALNSCGVDSETVAFLRLAVGTLVLIPVLLLVGGTKLFKIDAKGLVIAMAFGILGQALFNISYAEAIELIGMSVAAVLLYTSPVFVTIMSAVFFHEKIGYKKTIALVVNIVGCVLTVTGGHFNLSGLSLFGIIAGIASGFFYASMTIISTAGLKKYSPLSILFYGLLFGTLGVAAIGHPWQHLASVWNGPAMLIALGYGIIPTLCSYCFYMRGLQCDLETSKVPVIASVETIVASIIGIFVLHESAEIVKVLGIMVVFTSIIIMSMPAPARRTRRLWNLRYHMLWHRVSHPFKF